MKRRFVSIMFCLFLCFAFSVTTFAETSPKAEPIDFRSELCDVFPEYEAIIFSTLPKTVANTSSPQIIQGLEKVLDDNTEYHLVIYNDGTYIATRSTTKNLVGGVTSSGSGYTSHAGATLNIMQVNGLNDYLSVSVNPVSYTLVNGGYDYLSEASSVGAASRCKPGSTGGIVTPYACTRNAYVRNESAAGPARATYYIGVTSAASEAHLEFRVGGDRWRVYWNGSEI